MVLLEVKTIYDGIPKNLFEKSYKSLNNDEIIGWTFCFSIKYYQWLKRCIDL